MHVKTIKKSFADVEVITVDLNHVEEQNVDVGDRFTTATTSYPVTALQKSDGTYKTSTSVSCVRRSFDKRKFHPFTCVKPDITSFWVSVQVRWVVKKNFLWTFSKVRSHWGLINYLFKTILILVKGEVFVYQAVFHSLEPLFTVQTIPNPRYYKFLCWFHCTCSFFTCVFYWEQAFH